MKRFYLINNIISYRISILLISTLLSACGGGGGGGPGQSDREYEFDKYTGNQNAAQLTGDNHAVYLDLLFSKITNGQPETPVNNLSTSTSVNTQATSPILVNESEQCINNGTISFSGTLSDKGAGILDLNYQNCEIDGLIYQGKGALEINTVDQNTGYIQEAISVYEKVRVTDTVSSYHLSGTVSYNQDTPCAQEITTANLVLIDTQGANHYKTSDLTTISGTDQCSTVYQEEISGRIYHSEQGYVDISTITPLLYSSATAQFPGLAGVLLLVGINDSQARLSANELPAWNYYVPGALEYVNTFEVDANGDGNYELQATMSTSSFSLGGWRDISDTDGDGIPNSWELIYGLNDTAAGDALLDNDSDGYSNYLEYYKYGDPTDPTIVPIANDLSVSIDTPTDVRAGNEMTFSVLIDNPNITYPAQDIDLTLTKPGDARWTDLSLCQINTLNPNQLNCRIDDIFEDSARSIRLGLIADNPGDIILEATASASNHDHISDNNRTSASATFNQRQSNLGLLTGSNYTYHDVAVIGRSHTFKLLITQWGPDDAHDAVFTMSIPDNIRVESAEYNISPGFNSFPGSNGPCTIGSQIVCNIGKIQNNPGSYKGEINIRMTGLTEGISTYTASLTSASIDDTPDDNSFEQRLFIGKSLEDYQNQVTAANAPLTITIPAGYYVGGIDYQDKPVRIQSSAGAEQTYIWSDSPFGNTFFYPFQFFNIGTDGELSGFTYLGKFRAIHLSGTGSVIENNIFEFSSMEAHENLSSYINVLYAFESQTTIRNNIFKNNNLNHNINSPSCNLLYFYYTTSFTIENNLFHDNPGCSTIAVYDFDAYKSDNVKQIISNNTFVNTGDVAKLVKQNTNSVVKVQNNIFINNQLAVGASLPVYTEEGTTIAPPIAANNIFYTNTYDINIDGQVFGPPYTDPLGNISLTDNISADPLFIDPVNNDYRLHPASPGIDQGEAVDAPVMDLDGISRPQDGNINGVPEIDIGAYEYMAQ